MNTSADKVTPAVELVDVCKSFQTAHVSGDMVVNHMSLAIQPGEFFTFLGPSGCGKTTTLRMIAGFEQPTRGRIVLSGTDVSGLPAHRRNVNTVFQSYALFPHLNVEENVGFGLAVKRVPRAERPVRIRKALDMVRMGHALARKPSELSGGQQQRVALARALVNEPSVLLLDEPFGALDLKLRREMQFELKEMQRRLNITFVFVTHDQEEALTMSDRIAVMNAGHVHQVGDPVAIYERPADTFTAGFIGEMNLFSARILGNSAGDVVLEAAGGQYRWPGIAGESGTSVTLVVRPESLHFGAGWEGDFTLRGRLEEVVYVGADRRCIVRLETGEAVVIRIPNDIGKVEALPERGTPVTLTCPRDAVRVLVP